MPTDPSTVTITHRLYGTLLGAAASDMAATFVRDYYASANRGVNPDDTSIHPGDQLGKVVAELWQKDHSTAYMFLADYMSHIRIWGKEKIEDMPFSLILTGLTTFAWPAWATKEEADELRRTAQERVQEYFSGTWIG